MLTTSLLWSLYRSYYQYDFAGSGSIYTKGAYQKSELASHAGHFENEISFFREFLLKIDQWYAYYLQL